MAIVTSKLVASKTLQQFLVDKDSALPLAGGTIDVYKDNNRLERKNWYYRTGSPGSYSYAALANPLTLNGSGAIVDPSGNEINPYYYPFSEDDNSTPELYYIEVYNSDGTLQFTRQGFPPIEDGSNINEVTLYQNLITNNRFWQAGGKGATFNNDSEPTITCTNETNIVIAPSKHDGFHEPDIRFKKSKTGAVDSIEFVKKSLTDEKLTGDVTPQWYMNVKCTGATTGETYKFIQIPIAMGLRNLENENAIFTVQASRTAGTNDEPLQFRILKFLGSSGSSSGQGTQVNTSDIELDTTFAKYERTFQFPDVAAGEEPTATGDDAFYLQLSLPINTEFNFNIALPSIYLGSDSPTNNFESYSQADTVISAPRTGDYRQSINSVYPLGWVPCNNGSIGNTNSNANILESNQTWPLYKLIWENVSDLYAPVLGGRGASAYVDYVNEGGTPKTLTLTKNLGRVLIGANPVFDFTRNFTINLTSTASTGIDTGSDTITFADIGDLQTGDKASVDQTLYGLTANNEYYISVEAANELAFYNSLSDALAGTPKVDITGVYGTVLNLNNTDLSLTLASAADYELFVGTPVQLTVSGGSLPTDLSVNSVYYLTDPDPSGGLTTSFKLAETEERALSGYRTNFRTAGSGTFTVRSALGASIGESRHELSVGELARHTHPFSSDNPFYRQTGALLFGGATIEQNAELVTGTTDATGSNQDHNTIQPSTFANVYLKL